MKNGSPESNDLALTDVPAATTDTQPPRPVWKTLALASPVVLSLLSFPSVLPWMIAFWLAWSTLLVVRNRPGWIPLLACLCVLVVKLVARNPAMIAFAVVLAAVAFLRRRNATGNHASADEPAGKQRIVTTLVLWIAWGVMLAQWHSSANDSRSREPSQVRPIICIGDSLTDGMLPDHGFPDPLDAMVIPRVMNLGISGIASSQGHAQLERILRHNPQAVVIELGGHDFLQGKTRASTKANLVDMIAQCHANDAAVILLEIPRGFIFDPFASLEREIAYEHDVQLVADTWLREIVIRSPAVPPAKWFPEWQLSDDGIHSNPRGSRRIANRVRDALVSVFGEEILKAPLR